MEKQTEDTLTLLKEIPIRLFIVLSKFLIASGLIMYGWNVIMTSVFSFSKITLIQALGLLIFRIILFPAGTKKEVEPLAQVLQNFKSYIHIAAFILMLVFILSFFI